MARLRPIPPLLQRFLAALSEARTAHLEEEEKQKVSTECQAALAWLAEKEGLQKQLSKVREHRARTGWPGGS